MIARSYMNLEFLKPQLHWMTALQRDVKNLGLLKIKNRSTLNIGDSSVNTTMPTQVILDVTSVPTISSVSFRLGNNHKIYIPKNLESAFKADTNWAKLNLVPCESF